MRKLFLLLLLFPVLAKAQIQTVTLDGSKSFDPDGTIARYQWTQVGSLPSACTISCATCAVATVVPTSGQWLQGVYHFSLCVTDNSGGLACDTMNVTVVANPDKPPIVSLGPDVSVQLPTTVNLTAVASDPDGTVAGYAWTQISGPNTATFSSLNTSQTTIGNLIAGTYAIRCKVTDNLGASSADTVLITVRPANQLPAANAGPDQTVTLPVTTVAIGGFDSPASATIAWAQLSGNKATITFPTKSFTTVTGLQRGQYEFKKTVTNNGLSASDVVWITVKKKCNFFCQMFSWL